MFAFAFVLAFVLGVHADTLDRKEFFAKRFCKELFAVFGGGPETREGEARRPADLPLPRSRAPATSPRRPSLR
ncbi:hypothetical protein GCM10010406_00100 [Streptomyces thermolineatus]|uniref:Secreted protein n=1 Tax=Streptomyces thermolineatus TaxID=44033 RepID=A0ABN3KSL0_9ACTN